MWRTHKTTVVKNGRVTVGDKVRVWGINDTRRYVLITGTVVQIGRIGALDYIEIVGENREYLCEWAHECEKV